MYCFKCGKQLPARVVNCPDCDTPQKRRQRYRRRMILGLFIFLAGAVAGSLFDTMVFKGQVWEHSFLGYFSFGKSGEQVASESALISENAITTIEKNEASDEKAPVSVGEDSSETVSQPASAGLTVVALPEFGASLSAAVTSNASSTAVEPTAFEVASQPATIESAASAAVSAGETPAALEKRVFPAGKLLYKKVEALEKGTGSNYHGFLARDGSELIFASNRMKVDGVSAYQCFSKKPSAKANAERVFSWPGNIWTPETTPDNNMIVFSSDSVKPEHLFIYDRNTRNSMALTSGNSKNMMPSVSPDGRFVVFVSNRKGSNNIWLVGIDGSNLMQITSGTADDREPRWAPDGSAVIFTRILEPLKKSHIMKVLLEPLGEPKPLVDTAHRNWLADVSPDGSVVAFTRSESTDGSKNVLVLRELSSGKEEVLKPLGSAECFRPVWNADCSGMVFHAADSQGKSLYQAVFTREAD